ncbi:TPA: chromosome partitioning protein ParA [Clostridioides difficile]|nr:chromosome partitioning protein ParA [Clostridioides difficile]MCW0912433.1 chromosome partitioning protein ParA [Clostridioides difficile]MDI2978175.1 chromosome partitioning protein ParA [Clostridioides difficile]MDI6151117.1 chromosome partitioning protein ParA [Clostridioides difficile]MDI7827568.1 chromosome partitioning protein ParA [Clostridioides difficile]
MDDCNKLKRIEEYISTTKNSIALKMGKIEILNESISNKKSELVTLSEKYQDYLTIKMLIEESCSEARTNASELYSQLSTSSIQDIFGDRYKVKLVLDSKDGTPISEVKIIKKANGKEKEINPAEEDSGGLTDIIALSLLMAIGKTLDDNFAPNVFDEPTKFVSKGIFSEKVAEFVSNLIDYTGKQAIISTHDNNLINIAKTNYKLIQDKETGITTIYKMKGL